MAAQKPGTFDKKAFRQAVSYAIPYDTLLKSVMHGYAQKNRSIIGAGMPSSDFSFWKYNTDLKKAADKLKEAGYPGGSGAPVVSTNPQSQTITQGQPVTFSVTASGAGTLSYQWQRDRVNIPGATSASSPTANGSGRPAKHSSTSPTSPRDGARSPT